MTTFNYDSTHPIRLVTATSLFDGHDAALNIIRRLLQAEGAEVIHLGHNRSVDTIVQAAVQEDAQGIAVSSYQGGHLEFFKYMMDKLQKHGADHIKVFGGGGGVIVPQEVKTLERYGVSKIFSPTDGFEMGLQGMGRFILKSCNFSLSSLPAPTGHLARALTLLEQQKPVPSGSVSWAPLDLDTSPATTTVLGVTGTGGAGKSTLVDEFVRRFVTDFQEATVAVLAVDPSRRKTGGALLGDRLRINTLAGPHAKRIFMRSFATRGAAAAVYKTLHEAVQLCRQAAFDLIIVETAGIGQGDTSIVDLADLSVYVMTQEYGAPTQLEKIDMLDQADWVVLNKFDRPGSLDALRDIRKQLQRNRLAFEHPPEKMPVFPAMASRYNDPGVTRFYLKVLERLNQKRDQPYRSALALPSTQDPEDLALDTIIPDHRQQYLADVVDSCRAYRSRAEQQIDLTRKWEQVQGTLEQLKVQDNPSGQVAVPSLKKLARRWWDQLVPHTQKVLSEWQDLQKTYQRETFTYTVRGREITVPLQSRSLSGLPIPRVALPKTTSSAERLRFALFENLPGRFPFTAGVYPFKRRGEDPTRMFAGEGTPERTNKRFHLVSKEMSAKRLSTAFDSVTLYGADPAKRPDIYGKIGNAGVSICTLDDMKKLYSGFNLCDSKTSVSMTINGPAPTLLAMFMNTAIDQQTERMLKEQGRWAFAQKTISRHLEHQPQYIPYASDKQPAGHNGLGLGLLGITSSDLVAWEVISSEEHERIKAQTLQQVRGTVQADILKEDQAQNTCIFSTEFALRMMGDVQEHFVNHQVRNFYSVSVSGYHIAEAGANPITQLAFTLANGFTYVEYFLSRGLDIDAFAPNLSFFFSNGMDPEYSVIGRVARRIWAITMRDKYGGNERSQKLKYHIQTSGRSLHAREMQFNDIRTTLQALMAVYDNCNSLHTNAYDEALTTPTEESVRRALAIQMIIGKELGLTKNENPLQGSYIIEELTDLVEEAVFLEFNRLNQRGGVLGAMETMYQRSKIQDESLHYEQKKHSGELPIVGVNTFRPPNGPSSSSNGSQPSLMRSTHKEKQQQVKQLQLFHQRHASTAPQHLERLQQAARSHDNIFAELMETVKHCSLGQITNALFEVGGEYRRNM